MSKIQEIKNKANKLLKEKQYKQLNTEYYYCWDQTKYGLENLPEKGIKKVKAGYLINYPDKLKNFVFLPIL